MTRSKTAAALAGAMLLCAAMIADARPPVDPCYPCYVRYTACLQNIYSDPIYCHNQYMECASGSGCI